MSDPGQDATAPPTASTRERPARPGIFFYLILLAITGGVAYALFQVVQSREARLGAQEVAIAKAATAGLPVRTVKPKMSADSLEMLLSGDVRAYLESPIYAKVSGYLKTLTVDKGDRVESGQLLAVLETPETEQEYRTAEANLEIARITNERYQDLVRDRVVAPQTADRARADFLMAQSSLERLKALLDYRQLRAPFGGVVVARNYDPGVLVPAATTSTSTSSLPVLVVAKIDRLRVYVYVPQSDAMFIRVGDPTLITFDEFPGRIFEGRVSRYARALDAGTRTMLTEIELANADHTLMPGMYGHVKLRRKQPKSYPIVPDEALVFQNEKAFLPLVTPENRIHLQAVTLGQDNGTEVHITAGLEGDETIALGVGQTVAEGMAVRPVVAREQKPGGPAASPPATQPPASPAKPTAAPAGPAPAPEKPAAGAVPPDAKR